jgi:hypothetical protein
MAEKKSDSKKGKPSGAGRRKGKFEVFFSRTQEKKVRHILRRNGVKAAMAYIKAGHASSATLHKISKEVSVVGDAARAAFKTV